MNRRAVFFIAQPMRTGWTHAQTRTILRIWVVPCMARGVRCRSLPASKRRRRRIVLSGPSVLARQVLGADLLRDHRRPPADRRRRRRRDRRTVVPSDRSTRAASPSATRSSSVSRQVLSDIPSRRGPIGDFGFWSGGAGAPWQSPRFRSGDAIAKRRDASADERDLPDSDRSTRSATRARRSATGLAARRTVRQAAASSIQTGTSRTRPCRSPNSRHRANAPLPLWQHH